jgi:hypothetical protein
MGLQLFTRRLGPIGDYVTRFDWFYFDWHRFDWLGIRAGRIKIPYGLYNEQSDYDPGRLTIFMPQSIYPTTVRDFLLACTGAGIYGYIDLGKGGALSYAAVGGSIFLDISTAAPVAASIDVPYTLTGRVIWETPAKGLRVAASAVRTRLDGSFTLPQGTPGAPSGGVLDFKLPATLWVASAEYASDKVRLASEYGRWNVLVESSQPAVVPNSITVSERFYVAGAFNVSKRIEAGAYYSVLFPNIDNRQGRQNFQHDLAASFRMDLSDHWLVKVEPHLMYGTAALNSRLNGDKPLSQLTATWVLLAIKATAYF